MRQPDGVKSALVQAVVAQHDPVATSMWRMLLDVPVWKENQPAPGQFIMLRVSDDSDPLLGRPFGISGFKKGRRGAEVEIMYRVVGRGTGIMESWMPGRSVVFLGPLGRGFSLPPEGSSSLLVAGGVGLPPLLSLAREMEARDRVEEMSLIYGEASSDRLVDVASGMLPDLRIETCTEDGSCGTAGLVTDLLQVRDSGRECHLFVCGPNPMMKAVLDIAGKRCLSAQYSLEARMACGFGVCSGCAVKLASGVYERVCREGPVFNGSDLAPYSFASV